MALVLKYFDIMGPCNVNQGSSLEKQTKNGDSYAMCYSVYPNTAIVIHTADMRSVLYNGCLFIEEYEGYIELDHSSSCYAITLI